MKISVALTLKNARNRDRNPAHTRRGRASFGQVDRRVPTRSKHHADTDKKKRQTLSVPSAGGRDTGAYVARHGHYLPSREIDPGMAALCRDRRRVGRGQQEQVVALRSIDKSVIEWKCSPEATPFGGPWPIAYGSLERSDHIQTNVYAGGRGGLGHRISAKKGPQRITRASAARSPIGTASIRLASSSGVLASCSPAAKRASIAVLITDGS
jgi:hypothetical protein